MATTIQLLRSDIARQRPDPGVLANGVPMVNLHESEPGLFFSDRTGALFKVGPVAVGINAPNTNAEGEPGNVKGETWLDTSGANPILKVYDGGSWVKCFEDPGGTVTSVGLTFSSLFTVSNSPVTTSGTLTASLQDQVKNTVFAGPDTVDGAPSFRALSTNDIPALSATKITTGQFDSGRIPSLDASKITSGTFSASLIPSALTGISSISGLLTLDAPGALEITAGGAGNIILDSSGAGLVQIGSNAPTSPALKDNIAVLETRVSDDSDYAEHAAAIFQSAKAYTVGAGANQLPAGTVGQIARVTDAAAPAIGSTVAGGGAAAALCWYNGSNWTVIGV